MPTCAPKLLLVALAFTAVAVVAEATATAAESLAGRRPNIIFILTDDQGYGDLSCHGNPILKTPHIDRLHAEGVRFTDFHVSPTCSPTRSALLTGRHEFRNGVTHTILERERLTLKAVTLPEVLKSAGYATGIFGKWHLGDEAESSPTNVASMKSSFTARGASASLIPAVAATHPATRISIRQSCTTAAS